jgi:hypothetical protein
MKRRAVFRVRGGMLGCLLSMMLAMSACTGGDGEQPAGENPEELLRPMEDTCDGSLSESALADLRSLIEVYEGPSDDGRLGERRDRASNLAEYAATLRTSEVAHISEFCHIQSPGQLGAPFATIGFGWYSSSPSRSDLEDMAAIYATGEYAYVDGTAPATVGFRCPVNESRSEQFLSTMLFTFDRPGEYDLRMSITNSIAQSFAEEFGCLDEAGLSEGAPERVTE